MLWEKGLEKGQENSVLYLGPGAGAARWRVRGGERGTARGEAGLRCKVRAEAWGAVAAQMVRWSAHSSTFILCHSTAHGDSRVLHISLLINHIPSQPDLQLSVHHFIQLLNYLHNSFSTLAEEMCADRAAVGVRGRCDMTSTFPKAFPDPELQRRERFPAASNPDTLPCWAGALQTQKLTSQKSRSVTETWQWPACTH